MMMNKLHLFYYFAFVALILVSNASTDVLNDEESKESLIKLFDSPSHTHLNKTSFDDVMLNDNVDCDCGPNSEECWRDNDNGRKCKCKKGYAPKPNGIDQFCEECNCGKFGVACEFNQNTGRQNCTCADRYGPKYLNMTTGEQICEECYCGTNTKRCLKIASGTKYCWCQLGNFTDFYSTETNRLCKVCDCGPQSVLCDFNSNKNQFCKCKPEYSSEKITVNNDDEYCKRCDCGEHGKCNIKVVENRSVKECTCDAGYKEFKGKCRKCDCGLNSSNCTFYWYNGNQMCDCKKGYITKESFTSDDEYCEKCDCGEFSENCRFLFGNRRCTCKDGYTSDYGITEDDGICKEAGLGVLTIALITIAVIFIVVAGVAVMIRFILLSFRR